MSKIKTKVSREANFIYHMLSVSKCGYDNEYGQKYSSMHKADDLKILKDNEKMITVKGGEHVGELYTFFVAIPASLDAEAAGYYKSLKNIFEAGDIDENLNQYVSLYSELLYTDLDKTTEIFMRLKPQLLAMSNIMISNYDIYCSKIWEKSREELQAYSNGIQKAFENDNICSKLEKLTGISLGYDFIASFCNSLSGGAEAIDISNTQDIFGIGRNYEWAKKFISHEYVIFLFKKSFPKSLFTLQNWKCIESLAEFYLKQTIGLDLEYFEDLKDIIVFYEEECKLSPNVTALELFDKATRIYAV